MSWAQVMDGMDGGVLSVGLWRGVNFMEDS